MGFHTSCARHMCLGLLRDIAELTGSLAHDAAVKEVKISPSQPMKPDYNKALDEANILVRRYSARILELQEILVRRS